MQLVTLTLYRTIVEKEGKSSERAVVLDLKELEKDLRVKLLGWPGTSVRLIRESRG